MVDDIYFDSSITKYNPYNDFVEEYEFGNPNEKEFYIPINDEKIFAYASYEC